VRSGLQLLISLATQYTSHLIGENRSVPEALTTASGLAYLIGAGLAALAAAVTLKLLPKPTAAPQPVRSRLRVPATVLAVVACFVATDLATAALQGAPLAQNLFYKDPTKKKGANTNQAHTFRDI